MIVTDDKDIDCAAIQLCFLRKKIDVMTIYRRSGKQVKRKTWINLIKKSKVGNSKIVTGDFNAHHTI